MAKQRSVSGGMTHCPGDKISGSGDERGGYGESVFQGDRPAEADRLATLADTYDRASQTALSLLGLGDGWRCIDAGAGGTGGWPNGSPTWPTCLWPQREALRQKSSARPCSSYGLENCVHGEGRQRVSQGGNRPASGLSVWLLAFSDLVAGVLEDYRRSAIADTVKTTTNATVTLRRSAVRKPAD